MSIKYILDHQKKEIKEGDITGEPLVKKNLALQIFGYFFGMIMLTVLVMMGKEPIVNNPVKDGNLNPLFILILLQGLLMQHLTFCLQVNHVTKTQYSPFKNRVYIMLCLAVVAIYIINKPS